MILLSPTLAHHPITIFVPTCKNLVRELFWHILASRLLEEVAGAVGLAEDIRLRTKVRFGRAETWL